MPEFSEHETSVLLGLLRSDLRKRDRNKKANEARWGDDYDDTALHARVAVLVSCYRKLGAEPMNITNLDHAALGIGEPNTNGES